MNELNNKESTYDSLYKMLRNGKDISNHVEVGCGRRVHLLKSIVIKEYNVEVVDNSYNAPILGANQSRVECDLYNRYKNRYDFLCPVLDFCPPYLVMKRVETNPSVMCKFVPKDLQFREYIYRLYYKDLDYLIDEEHLNPSDLLSYSNWGYDYDLNKFVLIDYGLKDL